MLVICVFWSFFLLFSIMFLLKKAFCNVLVLFIFVCSSLSLSSWKCFEPEKKINWNLEQNPGHAGTLPVVLATCWAHFT